MANAAIDIEFSGEEPPESLFMKKLKRRGMTPTSLLEDYKQGNAGVDEEVVVNEQDRGLSRRNVVSTDVERSLKNPHNRRILFSSLLAIDWEERKFLINNLVLQMSFSCRVLHIMQKDAQEDPAIFSDTLHARRLVNQVDRKLVKQTMMTSVYGVMYIGAPKQIKRRLKERESGLDDDELFGTSCYAAKVTLTALEEMFQGARNIMKWLCDYAKVIASENQPVHWTTTLGLPVVQPYRKLRRHIVKTSLQMLTSQRETDKVSLTSCIDIWIIYFGGN
ncbi:DNA-directed RNA polymerase 2A-like [Arachis hypogaea]|uniref:DNA-directed RNA polymerase 2A-like n=1 Tax=Arachis hypogaea TaxID=3818 RepID=UPI003B2222C6